MRSRSLSVRFVEDSSLRDKMRCVSPRHVLSCAVTKKKLTSSTLVSSSPFAPVKAACSASRSPCGWIKKAKKAPATNRVLCARADASNARNKKEGGKKADNILEAFDVLRTHNDDSTIQISSCSSPYVVTGT